MTATSKFIASSAIAIATTFVVGQAFLVGQAHAADVPMNSPINLPMPDLRGTAPATPLFGSGGWYLRGDMGARWYRIGGVDVPTGITAPSTNSLRSGLDAGLGLGYKAGFLRADLTADYALPVDYKATTFASNDTTARVQMTTVLANLYFDLGTWGGLTPYIGAGAGYGFARTTELSRPLVAYTGATSYMQSRFAYSFAGGVAFKVAPNLQMDLGYRYVNYGDVKMGNEAFGDTTARKVAAHDVRLGLRWSFDDLPLH